MSAPVIPPLSPFRFFNIKKKLPKTLRSNPTDGPKLICTNENKTTTSGPVTLMESEPDVG
jgi:hypothetical protein